MRYFLGWRAFLFALCLAFGSPGMTTAAPLFPDLFPDELVNFGPRPVLNYSGSWIGVPSVFSMSYDPGGGGYGITSGYFGKYRNSAGEEKIAATNIDSQVFPAESGKKNRYDYFWTISNTGTGDFVEYYGPKPPKFLKGILKPGTTQSDSKADWGPPRLAYWGGRWNPEVGEEAPELQASPIPLPASALLLVGALGLLFARRLA